MTADRIHRLLSILVVLGWLVVLVVEAPSCRERVDPDREIDPELILALGDAGVLASGLPDDAWIVFLLPETLKPLRAHIARLCERWVGRRRTDFFFGELPVSLDALRLPNMEKLPPTYIICPRELAERIRSRRVAHWSALRRVTGFRVDWGG